MTTIRIVAALIRDAESRILLVRKRGTHRYMHPGGKIEPGEGAAEALSRELREELRVAVPASTLVPIARITAAAANEPGHLVDVDLFCAPMVHGARAAAEIEELVWVTAAQAVLLPLAPLTRDHVLPMLEAGTVPPPAR